MESFEQFVRHHNAISHHDDEQYQHLIVAQDKLKSYLLKQIKTLIQYFNEQGTPQDQIEQEVKQALMDPKYQKLFRLYYIQNNPQDIKQI